MTNFVIYDLETSGSGKGRENRGRDSERQVTATPNT